MIPKWIQMYKEVGRQVEEAGEEKKAKSENNEAETYMDELPKE